MAKKTRLCGSCGRQFLPSLHLHRYCTIECSKEAYRVHRADKKIQCKSCGKQFRGNGHRLYCSQTCWPSYSPPKQLDVITCKHCGINFRPNVKTQIYCTRKCGVEANTKQCTSRLNMLPVSPGSVGAAYELAVCSDLLLRGVAIFRSMSPSCSCDLIASVNDRLYRIEVTTAYHRKDGTLGWPAHDTSKYDVIALFLPNRSIVYIPDVFETSDHKAEVTK